MGTTYKFDEADLYDCNLTGSIVKCLLHDLSVNYFCFSGFPSLELRYLCSRKVFKCTLRQGRHKATFELTKAEAVASGAHFIGAVEGHDKMIFQKVQDALASIDTFDK